MKIDALTVGPIQTNCYIVYNEGAEEAVVIDPGAEAEKIKAALDGKRAAAVLLTHGHFDHTGALHAFADIPIYLHPSDDVMLLDPVWSAGTMIGDDAPRPAATNYVQEGTKLHLAGLDIAVMHTPGHTLGSVCYAIGDALFTGDTMFSGGYGRTDLPGGDEMSLAKSLRRLLREEKDWIICPGHGGPSTMEEEKEKYF
ncbi:MAG: MBL fold metallo-hydrolase [Clostridia bacterium]|nr:MBL fold metallo-hydrolase [Clostridia bacterium]